MIHHRPSSQIDDRRDREGEISGSYITARRDAIVAQSRKLGIPKSDLSDTAGAIVAIVQETWTGLGSRDLENLDLEGVDHEAVKRDSTYYDGSDPGPGLICGLRHMPDLFPIRGTTALYRIGQLVELHGLFTIRAPADFGSKWTELLAELGRDIQRGAGNIATDREFDLPALRARLSFLGGKLSLLGE
jgi:hypothetical protein